MSSNYPRSACNHREDRERIGSLYRLVLGGRTRAEAGVQGGRRSPWDQLKLNRPLTDLQRNTLPELSIVETMAAARAANDHGGGDDHGGRSAILDNNRRRIVGILCSKLGLAEIGGVLIQVYLLLTFTSFVENPDILYSLQLLVCPGNAFWTAKICENE